MLNLIRTILLGLTLLTLTACGGGTQAGDPQNPTPTPTPTPTPPVTSNNPPATIAFTSATPQVVGLQGSGQTTNSTLVFTVADSNGAPVADGIVVDFTINTLNGGEYIGPFDNTPTQSTAQTSGGAGLVTIGLTSGTVAGVVIVRATVNATSITAESSKISIGGGVADSAHLSLSTDKINLPGMVLDNVPATIQVLLGDRFGNYNVLKGTPVTFYAEAGTIDTSNVTDENGATTVTFRTQNPRPYTDSVAITSAEANEITRINTTYGLSIPTDGSVNQRRGWVTVVAAVAGQETFTDSNANGYYDLGDIFTPSDDLGEPYIDRNSNGLWDIGETYIDTKTNGAYDGPNGVWDGPKCPDTGCQSSKTIWDSITLMFTGNGAYCAFSNSTLSPTTITRGASQTYEFMVGDANLNMLVAGTKIAVTTTAGQLSGNTNYTVPDGIGGPTEISFTLLNNLAPTANATTATITVTVTPPTVSNTQIIGCPGNNAKTLAVSLQ